MVEGLLKVHSLNDDIKWYEYVKIIGNLNNGEESATQARLNNEKRKLKEYTNDVVRYCDGLELVKKII